MMANSLMTKADLQREQMNSLIIQTSNIESHQTYMFTLLKNAVEYGLINEYRMQDISELIMEAVATFCNSLVICMANTVYILNAYLQDMSGYDAYARLQQIESSKDAEELIKEANSAWQMKLIKCQERLAVAAGQAEKLQSEHISLQVKDFSKIIISLKNAVNSQEVNLKESHITYAHNIPMTYILLKECSTDGKILNNLWDEIFCFAIETLILCKLKEKGLLDAIKKDDEAFISGVEKQEKRLKRKMSNEKTLVRAALKDKKAERVALSLDFEAERHEINEEFKRETKEAIQRVEERYELQFQELYYLKEDLATEIDLNSVGSKIALFILASNGAMPYPDDAVSMINARNSLSTKTIAKVLLEYSGIELSTIEKEYLAKLA